MKFQVVKKIKQSVFLATDENDKKVVIKLIKLSENKMFQNEVSVHTMFSGNDFICRLLDWKQMIKFTEENQKSRIASVLMFEYAENGDFFDYIYIRPLSEKASKYYFARLVSILQNLHGNQVYHRDIKLENMVLDVDFQLKLIDFEFAQHPKISIDDNKFKKNFCGTRTYLAPEMIHRQEYKMEYVDIFAVGVTLFIILTGNFPFKDATPEDQLYKKIQNKQYEQFWQYHEQTQSYPQDFKDLFIGLVQFVPEQRFSLSHILNHPWLKDYSLGLDEIKQEMQSIKQEILVKHVEFQN